MGTFSISPYLTNYFAFVVQTFIVISYIWFSKDFKWPKNKFSQAFLKFFKRFFFALYFFFGILMVDSAVIWISGQYGYADWRFQLPSVLISLILGLQYLITTFWIKPTKFDLGYSITFISVFIGLMRFYLPGPFNLRFRAEFSIMIAFGIIFLYPMGKFVGDLISRKKEENRYLWDIGDSMYNLFNRKFNIIFWIIAMIEAMLKFAGSSLFLF